MQQTARKVKKSEFMGAGCLVQGFGFILAIPGFLLLLSSVLASAALKAETGANMETAKGMNVGFFVLGVLLFGGGASLLLWGYKLAVKYSCGACGNRVEETARLCPTCHSPLS